MKRGKEVCKKLKAIRSEIAAANEIDYTPIECHHESDCAGTCPACEKELRWLESMLRRRQALGKAVTLAGLTVAMGALSSCNNDSGTTDAGYLEDDTCFNDTCAANIEAAGIQENDSDKVLVLGEFVAPEEEPAEINGITQPEDPNDNRDKK